MTLSRTAAFVSELVDPFTDPYDLRHLFSPTEAGAPRRTGRSRRALRKVKSTGGSGEADESPDADTDEDLEDGDFDEAEDESQDEAEDEAAEDDPGGDEDDDTAGEDDGEEEDEEDVRNSKGRNLSRESARYRVAARNATAAAQAATERATAAEDALRATRTQLAFLQAAQAGGFAFVEPLEAMKIADLSKVTVDDDGTVSGMDTAVELLADEHSYLLVGNDSDSKSRRKERDRLADLPPSGGTNNGKRKGTDQPSSEVLKQKFPALRTRR